MNFKEYIKEAKKTESINFKEIGVRLKDKNVLRMLHAAMGMATECEELRQAFINGDEKNVKEEIGDLCWYLAIAYDVAMDEFGDIIKIPETLGITYINGIDVLLFYIIPEVNEFLDMLKKFIFYDKGYSQLRIEITLSNILISTYRMCSDTVDFETMLKDNIKKLNKRYGDKFSKDGALNRNVDNELSHIKD